MHTLDLSVMYEGGEFSTVINHESVPKTGDSFDIEIEGKTRQVVVTSVMPAIHFKVESGFRSIAGSSDHDSRTQLKFHCFSSTGFLPRFTIAGKTYKN